MEVINLVANGFTWIKDKISIGTKKTLSNVMMHIKGDRPLVLTSKTTTYPEGNSRPVFELRNVVDPLQSDGAGGVVSWTSYNTKWVRKIAGWLNAGFIVNKVGEEDTCLDFGFHHKGKWEVMAIRADWDKIHIPPGWSLGDLENINSKMFSGGLKTLPGPDGTHGIYFKWVWPPGYIEVYIDVTRIGILKLE